MASYQSISMEDDDPEEAVHHIGDANGYPAPKPWRRFFSPACVVVAALCFLAGVILPDAGERYRAKRSPGAKDDADASGGLIGSAGGSSGDEGNGANASGGLIGSAGSDGGGASDDAPPLPTGVNLAAWLSLEDWFFVGPNGAVEVASPDDAVAAACLPPLHLDASTGPRWNSETDLLAGLAEHYAQMMEEEDDGTGRTLGGYPNEKSQRLGGWGKAIKAIHAFRSSYLDLDADLGEMSGLGIQYARVPISWCFTDHDPSEMVTKVVAEDGDEGDAWTYMSDEEVKDKFTCRDPFYEDVYWPAIPRSLVQRFLRACAKHGIGATLDIHTYPGGTSIGTFSGVWPRYSRFWTDGDVPATDGNAPDVGRTILKDFVGWLESLAVDDPEAFQGLRALSPMNEPAHLAGLYDGAKPVRTDRETFLPPLPDDIASEYLSELNDGLDTKPELTKVPDGNHLRVLMWLRDAIDTFRQSKLPSLGKELHVNVHESVFPTDVLPKQDPRPDYGLNTGSMRVFGAWWRASTSSAERSKWAVLDIHHYHAWGPECSGAVEGPPAGRYACSDNAARAEVLGTCATWSKVYRSTLEEECGEGLRLASAEFSASTHHSVRHGCNDLSTLEMMLVSQVKAANEADVELFWWSYKMPYGGAFRRAWSLKHLLYILGVVPKPDEELFHCGDHVPPSGEPKDGSI